MAATAMTVEFGRIHHYPSLEENLKAFLCSSFFFFFFFPDTKINWAIYELWHIFGLE